jgi:hypothetical protein
MIWVGYNIVQGADKFTVKGDWDGEVMGWPKDPNDKESFNKENTLYQPGDVFRVDDDGWLIKIHTKDGVVRE